MCSRVSCVSVSVRVWLYVFVRAGVRASVRACARARACVRVHTVKCVCAPVHQKKTAETERRKAARRGEKPRNPSPIRTQFGAILRNSERKTQFSLPEAYPPVGPGNEKCNSAGPRLLYYNTRTESPPPPSPRVPIHSSLSPRSRGVLPTNPPRALLDFYLRRSWSAF